MTDWDTGGEKMGHSNKHRPKRNREEKLKPKKKRKKIPGGVSRQAEAEKGWLASIYPLLILSYVYLLLVGGN